MELETSISTIDWFSALLVHFRRGPEERHKRPQGSVGTIRETEAEGKIRVPISKVAVALVALNARSAPKSKSRDRQRLQEIGR